MTRAVAAVAQRSGVRAQKVAPLFVCGWVASQALHLLCGQQSIVLLWVVCVCVYLQVCVGDVLLCVFVLCCGEKFVLA